MMGLRYIWGKMKTAIIQHWGIIKLVEIHLKTALFHKIFDD
jgi:hypothetical protein